MYNCEICECFFENINPTGLCDECDGIWCFVDNDLDRLITSFEAVYNYFIGKPETTVYSVVADVLTVAKGGFKQCSNKSCRRTFKATTEFFHKRAKSKDGLDSWCKECKADYDKWHHLEKTHGISKEVFYQMLKKQNNCCGICKKPFDLKKTSSEIIPQILGRPKILPEQDHCHATERRRELLCKPCNVGIGCFYEKIEYLKNAIRRNTNNVK